MLASFDTHGQDVGNIHTSHTNMSNYLVLIVKRPKLESIQNWLKRYSSDPSEIVANKVSENTFLFIISKGVMEDVYPSEGSFFKGYAIDHTRKEIIFGAQGNRLHAALAEEEANKKNGMEGCYINCTWSKKEFLFNNDAFSLCSMLYFFEPDIFGISDSFYILARIRSHLGLPNTPNEEAILARSWSNTMAGQFLSNETQIDQIEYAPLGTTIKVKNDEVLNIEVNAASPNDVNLSLELENYEDEIRGSMQRITSVIETLAQISINSVRIALSGGLDSRVVLAAALASPAARNLAIFNCANNLEKQNVDFEVVCALSAEFDFPLGLRDPSIFKSVKDQLDNPGNLWVLANAGLYDFFTHQHFLARRLQSLNWVDSVPKYTKGCTVGDQSSKLAIIFTKSSLKMRL